LRNYRANFRQEVRRHDTYPGGVTNPVRIFWPAFSPLAHGASEKCRDRVPNDHQYGASRVNICVIVPRRN
jgi:hypothetical protein